jgi:putative endonuclease
MGFVYIITNKNNTVLYTGVSSDIKGRIEKHKSNYYPKSFSSRYNCHKLVYFEKQPSMIESIKREKQIKAGSRAKKIKLIESMNPQWEDLYSTL